MNVIKIFKNKNISNLINRISEMRSNKNVKTIEDVADLLADFNVTILLMDDCRIEFLFSKTEKEKRAIQDIQNNRFDDFSHIPKNDPIHLKRKTRYFIQGIVENPRFWRLTTVAEQLTRFKLNNNKQKNKPYGSIQTRKKAKENFCIVFENMNFAKKFLKDLKKTKLFKNEKVY